LHLLHLGFELVDFGFSGLRGETAKAEAGGTCY
jgi:hypothetical protein